MIANEVLDAALGYIIDNTTDIIFCSEFPTTFAEAVSTYRLGIKSSPSFTGPFDDGEGGRYITLEAISDGTPENAGFVAYIALVDDENDRVLRVKTLDAPEEIDGHTNITMTAMNIGIGMAS